MDKIYSNIEQILKENKTIGIFLSGGLDSSVLAYLVLSLKARHKTNNELYFFTVKKHDNSEVYSKKVLSYLKEKFSEDIKNHIFVGDPSLYHGYVVLSGILEASKYDLDIFLLADTTNPPHLTNGPARYRSQYEKVYQPFFDLNKDKTVEIAIQENILDLIKITHSCTQLKIKRCNNCWQCSERKWAFEQNNISDPGIF